MFGAFRLTKDIKSRQLIVSLMADIRPSSDRRIEAATVSATRFENGSCFPKIPFHWECPGRLAGRSQSGSTARVNCPFFGVQLYHSACSGQ